MPYGWVGMRGCEPMPPDSIRAGQRPGSSSIESETCDDANVRSSAQRSEIGYFLGVWSIGAGMHSSALRACLSLVPAPFGPFGDH